MKERDTQEHTASAPPFVVVDALGLLARGLAMGAADVVPGVSGGTIALITGVYERFIAALRSLSPRFAVELARGRPRQSLAQLRAIHWAVLAPIGAGVLIAIATMSRVIPPLMENHPAPTFGLFFGLILASSWVPVSMMKRRRAAHALAALATAAAAFAFVGLQPASTNFRIAHQTGSGAAVVYAGSIRDVADLAPLRALSASVSKTHGAEKAGKDDGSASSLVLFDPKDVLARAGVSPRAGERFIEDQAVFSELVLSMGEPGAVIVDARAPLWWIFFCGAIAISAMMLPGISGAFLLLFLGQYHAVLGSVHALTDHFFTAMGGEPGTMSILTASPWWSDVIFLGAFGLGVLVGLATFSRFVSWLFSRWHDLTMAALTGLMLGALRQPGRVLLDEAQGPAASSSWGMVAVAVVIGACVVLALSALDARLGAGRTSR